MHNNNHGQVGAGLYIRMTSQKIKEYSGKVFEHGQYAGYTAENELGELYIIPIKIDDTTEGEYEVVCENGTEFY